MNELQKLIDNMTTEQLTELKKLIIKKLPNKNKKKSTKLKKELIEARDELDKFLEEEQDNKIMACTKYESQERVGIILKLICRGVKVNKIVENGYKYIQTITWDKVCDKWIKLFDHAYEDVLRARTTAELKKKVKPETRAKNRKKRKKKKQLPEVESPKRGHWIKLGRLW